MFLLGYISTKNADSKLYKPINMIPRSKGRKSDARDFAFKKKSPILPIIYETKRGIKIRNKNYSFFMYKQSKRTPFRV